MYVPRKPPRDALKPHSALPIFIVPAIYILVRVVLHSPITVDWLHLLLQIGI